MMNIGKEKTLPPTLSFTLLPTLDAWQFWSTMLTPSLQVAMNELSNHDHSRFLTRTNHIVGRVEQHGSRAAEEGVNPAVMREAVVIQMTWVGAPTIYYGDEVGVCGFTDPDNRRTYPWGREDQMMLGFHKEMIRIHKRQHPLRQGSLRILCWDNNVLAYGRFQGDDQVIVVLNNSKDLKEITVPVWKAEVPMKGRMKRLIGQILDDPLTELRPVVKLINLMEIVLTKPGF